MKINQRLVFPRTLLLAEISRYCSFSDCGVRMLIGLTKEEAKAYRGFECSSCGRWNEDTLTEYDIPEWRSDLNG